MGWPVSGAGMGTQAAGGLGVEEEAGLTARGMERGEGTEAAQALLGAHSPQSSPAILAWPPTCSESKPLPCVPRPCDHLHQPCHSLPPFFLLTFPSRLFSSLQALVHPPKMPFLPVPSCLTQAAQNAACPSKMSAALAAGRSEHLALFPPFPSHSSASLCVLGASVH